MTDIIIKPRFEIEQLINEDCAQFRQRSAVCVLRILTEHYKERLNSEVYDELIKFYSLSESERAEYKSQKRVQRGLDKAKKRRIRKVLDEIALCQTRVKEHEKDPKKLSYWQIRLADAKRNLEFERMAQSGQEPEPTVRKSGKVTFKKGEK